MINLKGIMGIPLLKKSRFTGSDGELRFVLEKQSSEEEGDRLGGNLLVWKAVLRCNARRRKDHQVFSI